MLWRRMRGCGVSAVVMIGFLTISRCDTSPPLPAIASSPGGTDHYDPPNALRSSLLRIRGGNLPDKTRVAFPTLYDGADMEDTEGLDMFVSRRGMVCKDLLRNGEEVSAHAHPRSRAESVAVLELS
jgi:hypothetical protein